MTLGSCSWRLVGIKNDFISLAGNLCSLLCLCFGFTRKLTMCSYSWFAFQCYSVERKWATKLGNKKSYFHSAFVIFYDTDLSSFLCVCLLVKPLMSDISSLLKVISLLLLSLYCVLRVATCFLNLSILQCNCHLVQCYLSLWLKS